MANGGAVAWALLGAIVLPLGAAGDGPIREEDQSYVHTITGVSFIDAQGLGGVLMCDPAGTGLHIEGPCFRLDGAERRVTLTVHDMFVGGSAMEVWFMDADFAFVQFFGFVLCGGHGTLNVLPGTAFILVHFQDALPKCPPGRATVGSVHAAFFA